MEKQGKQDKIIYRFICCVVLSCLCLSCVVLSYRALPCLVLYCLFVVSSLPSLGLFLSFFSPCSCVFLYCLLSCPIALSTVLPYGLVCPSARLLLCIKLSNMTGREERSQASIKNMTLRFLLLKEQPKTFSLRRTRLCMLLWAVRIKDSSILE